MNDPLLSAKLRSILAALRTDIRPELSSPQARLRHELIEMLIARMAVEADAEPCPAGDVAAEAAWRAAHEAEIAAILAQPPAKAGSANELEIPASTFTAWFAARDPTVRVDRTTTVPGGRSKGTILLDAADGRQFVVRRDFSAALTGTSVADEFPTIQAVHKAGIRAPAPLWLETAPDAIGGRFIVFERLPGRAMGTLFASDASPDFCKDFAGELARLHRLDPAALGLEDALQFGREAHPVQALLASFKARYRAGMPPVPLIDRAFAWLHAQLPRIGNARRIVHGDAGLHNTLGDGDRLTGLLDWEFAHVGDPAEDLAYCRFLVGQILPWDDFIAAYRASGGEAISAERMAFFAVWRTLMLSLLTGFARAAYDSGKDRDLRVAAIGHNTFPKQLKDLAADLEKGMKG